MVRNENISESVGKTSHPSKSRTIPFGVINGFSSNSGTVQRRNHSFEIHVSPFDAVPLNSYSWRYISQRDIQLFSVYLTAFPRINQCHKSCFNFHTSKWMDHTCDILASFLVTFYDRLLNWASLFTTLWSYFFWLVCAQSGKSYAKKIQTFLYNGCKLVKYVQGFFSETVTESAS